MSNPLVMRIELVTTDTLGKPAGYLAVEEHGTKWDQVKLVFDGKECFVDAAELSLAIRKVTLR